MSEFDNGPESGVCPYCGSKLQFGIKYCSVCGGKVISESDSNRHDQGGNFNYRRKPYNSSGRYISKKSQIRKRNMERLPGIIRMWLQTLLTSMDLSGRITRMQFWSFTLFNILVFYLITEFLVGLLKLGISTTSLVVLVIIVRLVFGFLNFSAWVRRAHDADFGGWTFWCPFLNFIVLLLPSSPGTNSYGPPPEE